MFGQNHLKANHKHCETKSLKALWASATSLMAKPRAAGMMNSGRIPLYSSICWISVPWDKERPQLSDWDDPPSLKKKTSKTHHHDPNITPTLWKTWLDSLSKSSLYVLFSGTLSIPLWCRRETQQPPIIFKNCFVQNNHPAVTNPFSKHPSKKNEKLPAKTSPTLVTSTPP